MLHIEYTQSGSKIEYSYSIKFMLISTPSAEEFNVKSNHIIMSLSSKFSTGHIATSQWVSYFYVHGPQNVLKQ